MSKISISVIDPFELEVLIKKVVKDELWKKLPASIRKATENKELTASQVVEEFSISYNLQKKLRNTHQIRFKRKGQTIIYERSEFVRWLHQNRVKENIA